MQLSHHRYTPPWVGSFLLLLATLLGTEACETQTWEQYMEAAAFAYQDENFVDAERWFLAAEQVALGFASTDPRLAVTLGNLADLYHAQARDVEAEPLYQEALERLERIDGPESPRVARFVADLASFYAILDRTEEAKPLFLRALDTLDWELGPDHRDVLVIRTGLAGLYLELGEYGNADPLYREVLSILLASEEPDQDHLMTVLRDYARVLRATGRESDALALETRWQALRNAL